MLKKDVYNWQSYVIDVSLCKNKAYFRGDQLWLSL